MVNLDGLSHGEQKWQVKESNERQSGSNRYTCGSHTIKF